MSPNPLNDLFNLDPFAELTTFREAMRQMVEAGWPIPRDFMPAGMASVVVPLDILDTGSDLLVITNLPGVRPEDVSLSILGNTLTIKGQLKAPPVIEGAAYLHRERRATGFYRSVSLPVEVNADAADAQFENGVLTLTLPKSDKVRPRTIRVNSE